MSDTDTTYRGWKEIAAALGKNTKTARRYAKYKGLPVDVVDGQPETTLQRIQAWRKARTVSYSVHLELKLKRVPPLTGPSVASAKPSRRKDAAAAA
jgi:hypothetical protein